MVSPFNVEITLEDGSYASGITIDLKYANGTYAWTQGSLTTGANGKLSTDQEVMYWKNDTEGVFTELGPFILIASKIGLQTLEVTDLDLVPSADFVDVSGFIYQATMIKDTAVYPAESDVEDGVTYGPTGTDYTGNVVLPAGSDVRLGVGFGANGAEFEGSVVLPAESVVEDGVGYGAGGLEFEGSLIAPQAPLDLAIDLPVTPNIDVAIQSLTVAVDIPALSIAVDVDDLNLSIDLGDSDIEVEIG